MSVKPTTQSSQSPCCVLSDTYTFPAWYFTRRRNFQWFWFHFDYQCFGWCGKNYTSAYPRCWCTKKSCEDGCADICDSICCTGEGADVRTPSCLTILLAPVWIPGLLVFKCLAFRWSQYRKDQNGNGELDLEACPQHSTMGGQTDGYQQPLPLAPPVSLVGAHLPEADSQGQGQPDSPPAAQPNIPTAQSGVQSARTAPQVNNARLHATTVEDSNEGGRSSENSAPDDSIEDEIFLELDIQYLMEERLAEVFGPRPPYTSKP